MEIGKLNQRITFLEHYTKVDEIGNHEARWDQIKTGCKSNDYNISGANSKRLFTVKQTIAYR